MKPLLACQRGPPWLACGRPMSASKRIRCRYSPGVRVHPSQMAPGFTGTSRPSGQPESARLARISNFLARFIKRRAGRRPSLPA